jgi:hypothetical protein
MMHLTGWDRRWLSLVGVLGLLALQLAGGISCSEAREPTLRSMGFVAGCPDAASERSGVFHLAEMVQREDSVILRSDPKDRNYQERQWEEREKEKRSWDMLRNMVIDGRQPPPRRFSDPAGNTRPH